MVALRESRGFHRPRTHVRPQLPPNATAPVRHRMVAGVRTLPTPVPSSSPASARPPCNCRGRDGTPPSPPQRATAREGEGVGADTESDGRAEASRV